MIIYSFNILDPIEKNHQKKYLKGNLLFQSFNLLPWLLRSVGKSIIMPVKFSNKLGMASPSKCRQGTKSLVLFTKDQYIHQTDMECFCICCKLHNLYR